MQTLPSCRLAFASLLFVLRAVRETRGIELEDMRA